MPYTTTQSPWLPGWISDSFVTGEFMYPLEQANSHPMHIKDEIDRRIRAEIDDQHRIMNAVNYPGYGKLEWHHEMFHRTSYEFCFWYDREATSASTDDAMLHTVGLLLHAYHYQIKDPQGNFFPCTWLIPCARAIRERVYGEIGRAWDDEYP